MGARRAASRLVLRYSTACMSGFISESTSRRAVSSRAVPTAVVGCVFELSELLTETSRRSGADGPDIGSDRGSGIGIGSRYAFLRAGRLLRGTRTRPRRSLFRSGV